MENSPPSGNGTVNGHASAPSESYVPSTGPQDAASTTSRHSRVTSTVAQSFAADLDSMFGLNSGGGGVDALSQNVEERKQGVSTGQSELEQLEAKLRETEQRLARVSRQNSPSRQATTGAVAADPKTAALRGDGEQRQPHPLSQKPTYPADRPPTGQRQDTQQMMQRMPGAMPGSGTNTPGASRDDYVMVDDGRGR